MSELYKAKRNDLYPRDEWVEGLPAYNSNGVLCIQRVYDDYISYMPIQEETLVQVSGKAVDERNEFHQKFLDECRESESQRLLAKSLEARVRELERGLVEINSLVNVPNFRTGSAREIIKIIEILTPKSEV